MGYVHFIESRFIESHIIESHFIEAHIIESTFHRITFHRITFHRMHISSKAHFIESRFIESRFIECSFHRMLISSNTHFIELQLSATLTCEKTPTTIYRVSQKNLHGSVGSAHSILNLLGLTHKKSFSFMRDYIVMYVCLSYIHQ